MCRTYSDHLCGKPKEAHTVVGMQVLGWEGLWGTLGMTVIGMPLAWFLPGADIGPLNSEANAHLRL